MPTQAKINGKNWKSTVDNATLADQLANAIRSAAANQDVVLAGQDDAGNPLRLVIKQPDVVIDGGVPIDPKPNGNITQSVLITLKITGAVSTEP